MGALATDILRLALGVGVPFSWTLWLAVSALWLLVGPPLALVAPRVIDPIAAQVVARPERVALWMPGSIVATFGVIFGLALTIVGIPLTVLVVAAIPLLLAAGYLAVALVLGDVASRRLWRPLPAWAAALLGLALLRLLRALPLIGAAAQSVVLWVGYASAAALLWAAVRSWHRRRMPDVEQFAGETLVEWYPDGDPADGRPAVGTGRPVVGNLRGEEDRRSILDADEDSASS